MSLLILTLVATSDIIILENVTRCRKGAIMAIIKQYHKDTDTTYVYESVSYWDAEKGQSRSKRRVIGKLDPVTGEIIPTGKRGRTKQENNEEPAPLKKSISSSDDSAQKILQLELTITTLNKRIKELENTVEMYQKAMDHISTLSAKISTECSTVISE